MLSKIIIAVAVITGIVFSTCTYTVDETQRAILFKFGEIKAADIEPGLHFKMPFINNVRVFDSRILTLDVQPDLFPTSEKKYVYVDFFVKWRIDNVRDYFVATGGVEERANSRLSQITKDELRDEFASRTIKEAVSGERSDIMEALVVKANQISQELGIEIVDLRVSRIDYTDDISGSVYDRMRAERDRVAKDFRARGRESSERIRAAADRERQITLADAYKVSEQLRGEGDATAADIYARSYGKDPEFYSLTKSLTAYKQTFTSKNDVLVLQPDSQFFRYFNESSPR
ncbi:MAG: HflC protein [Gammaproteobacteria bacterium TMED119]|nr:MAG: HflC protein [Gammaproteobacteria bacterium TMED119]RCL45114.1 MAG: protease modulator HflC [Candidatus Thioglobus sp.]|tara:strand:- start:38 stop:901 length:864 start_codon:yes stop_codon:yes gene_type:complete